MRFPEGPYITIKCCLLPHFTADQSVKGSSHDTAAVRRRIFRIGSLSGKSFKHQIVNLDEMISKRIEQRAERQ